MRIILQEIANRSVRKNMGNGSQNTLQLDEVELAFDALMRGEKQDLLDIVKETPIGKKTGVHIYRRTSISALISALNETYASCRCILGDDYFNQCAVSYCHRYPMIDNDLNMYGADFPAYMEHLVETRDELSDLSFVAELCHFEWALNKSYFADQKRIFDFEGFANLDDEERDKLVFLLGADVALVKARSNVQELYDFHQDSQNIVNEQKFDLVSGEFHYIIHRGTHHSAFKVMTKEVDAYSYSILEDIQAGVNFSALCEKHIRLVDGSSQLPPFGDFIACGFIQAYHFPKTVP